MTAVECESVLEGETRQWLLGLARRCIMAELAGEAPPRPETLPAGVEVPRGCFVSLHRRSGALRGCIGTFDDSVPLWRNVMRMAVAAATEDPRFPPLARDELSDCVLEISALTPRQEARAEDVVVGRHGIWISRGHRSGVLLPQVAIEYGWDRHTFLAHTCLKAGLPAEAWREAGTLIELFSAEVFGEQKL